MTFFRNANTDGLSRGERGPGPWGPQVAVPEFDCAYQAWGAMQRTMCEKSLSDVRHRICLGRCGLSCAIVSCREKRAGTSRNGFLRLCERNQLSKTAIRRGAQRRFMSRVLPRCFSQEAVKWATDYEYSCVYEIRTGALSCLITFFCGRGPRLNWPTPVLSTRPLHTNSGCGKERRILIGPW